MDNNSSELLGKNYKPMINVFIHCRTQFMQSISNVIKGIEVCVANSGVFGWRPKFSQFVWVVAFYRYLPMFKRFRVPREFMAALTFAQRH